MIPKKMQETLLFYMKLAKVHHGNSIDSFKNSRDIHDCITQEIPDTIKWLESQPTEQAK